MKTRAGSGVGLLLLVGSLLVAPACGKRGAPELPLRPSPSAVTELRLVRHGRDVMLRFKAPTLNLDGTDPVALDRIEVYAMTVPAGRFAPNGKQLLRPENLLTTFRPRVIDPKTVQPETFFYVDRNVVVPEPAIAPLAAAPAVPVPETAATAGQPPAPVVRIDLPEATRFYLFQTFATSRRRGGVETVGVPLAIDPPAPQGPVLTYDEVSLKLAWTLLPDTFYVVYATGNGVSDDAPPLTETRLTVGSFSMPVVFDKPICLVVRAAAGTPPLTVESPPTTPVCDTPKDTFPPPAPAGLLALASPGSISLSWEGVTAADLGGYIVLRGEGSGDRLQPLMTVPVNDTSYIDRSTKPGVQYFYVVVAVDKATPANRSKPSNQVTETGR